MLHKRKPSWTTDPSPRHRSPPQTVGPAGFTGPRCPEESPCPGQPQPAAGRRVRSSGGAQDPPLARTVTPWASPQCHRSPQQAEHRRLLGSAEMLSHSKCHTLKISRRAVCSAAAWVPQCHQSATHEPRELCPYPNTQQPSFPYGSSARVPCVAIPPQVTPPTLHLPLTSTGCCSSSP